MMFDDIVIELRLVRQQNVAMLARLTFLEATVREGFRKMSGSVDTIQNELQNIKDAQTNLNAALTDVANNMNALEQDLQAALLAAQQAGAQPQQLADMKAIADGLNSQTAAMRTLIANNPVPAAPSGGDTTSGGQSTTSGGAGTTGTDSTAGGASSTSGGASS